MKLITGLSFSLLIAFVFTVELMGKETGEQIGQDFHELKIPIIFGIPADHPHADFYRHGDLDEEIAITARETNSQLLLRGHAIARSIIDLIHTDIPDWSNMKQQAKKVFNDYVEDPSLFLAEQFVAATIQRVLITEIDSVRVDNILYDITFLEDELAALAFSTSLFVKNESPNADVIALNLRLLGDYLDEDKRKEYATKAVEHSINWFGENRFELAASQNEIADVKFRQVYSSVEFLTSEFLSDY